jgi:nucleoside-diphosphate-sugar epimerase
VLAATTPVAASNEIYNVGSGTQTSLRALVEFARGVLGISAPAEWGAYERRPWDASVWVANPRKIGDELGWRPKRELEDGIAQLAAWLRERPALWERYGVRA